MRCVVSRSPILCEPDRHLTAGLRWISDHAVSSKVRTPASQKPCSYSQNDEASARYLLVLCSIDGQYDGQIPEGVTTPKHLQ